VSDETNDRALVLRALHRLAAAARQGQDPEAHPAVEALVAYHAGELGADEEGEIRRHLLVCRDCPDLILALDNFTRLPESAVESLEFLPTGMETAWQKVRGQLASEGWFESAAALPVPARRRRPLVAPGPLFAAAAVLAAACLGIFLLHQGPAGPPRIVETPPAPARAWDRELPPAVRGPGAKSPVVELPGSAATFVLVVAPEGAWESPEYQVEIIHPGALQSIWSQRWRPRSNTAPLVVVVPRDFLPAGDHLLRLRGRNSAEPVDERPFRLVFQ
jgi:Putative zinc-finger